MSDQLVFQLISSAITICVAVGGWIFTYKVQNQSKELLTKQRKIERLEQEVRSRIALEKTACGWVAELTGRSALSIQRELRKKTHEGSGLRPKMSDADLA